MTAKWKGSEILAISGLDISNFKQRGIEGGTFRWTFIPRQTISMISLGLIAVLITNSVALSAPLLCLINARDVHWIAPGICGAAVRQWQEKLVTLPIDLCHLAGEMASVAQRRRIVNHQCETCAGSTCFCNRPYAEIRNFPTNFLRFLPWPNPATVPVAI